MNRKLRIILDNLGGDFKHVKENRYIHVYVSSMAYMIWKQGNHGNEGNKSEHFLRTSHSEEVVKLKTWQGVMIVLLLVSHRVMLSASQSPLVCLTFSYFSPHDRQSCVWPCPAFLLTITNRVFNIVLLIASRSPLMFLAFTISTMVWGPWKVLVDEFSSTAI